MDDEDVIRLRRVVVRLARQFNTSSTGEGLTPSQSSVLGLIVSRGPLLLADLGELEGLNPTMVSRVVGRLHEMNLITRNPGPSDLRTASVAATATGILVCQRIQKRQTDTVSRCLRLLDSSRETTLLEALPVLEELDAIRST
jgi:DNA-binding MarR family transcriptional regulator